MGSILRWHNTALREVFTAHKGEEISTTGDGFFVSFDSPDLAIVASIAIQRRLAEHRATQGFAPQVRIGLHASDATWVGGDFHGKGVHEASRIAALGGAGDIVASVGTVGSRIGRPPPEARRSGAVGAHRGRQRRVALKAPMCGPCERVAPHSGDSSRVLRSLEAQSLISGRGEPGRTRRVRRLQLTQAGLAERAELDRRSDDVASSILEPLSVSQRARLILAMAEVERLLRASAMRIAVEDPSSADSRWCLEQYFSELAARFDMGFDPSLSISAAADEMTPPAGLSSSSSPARVRSRSAAEPSSSIPVRQPS